MKKWLIMASTVALLSVSNAASSISTYFDQFKSFSADFLQTAKQDGKVVQQSTGKVQLKKPMKFRWDYQNPEKMQLISDGKKFYHYDIDLAQATVKPASEITNSALSTLLSGSEKIEDVFTVQSFAVSAVKKRFPAQASSWLANADIFYELVPKKVMGDVQLTSVIVGLNTNQELRVFYAQDNFGENTFIFNHIKQNHTISDKTFHFKAPEGVDILGE